MAQILLVSRDTVVGSGVADVLERAGHDVMWCPGPQSPDYICAAGRPRRCVLTGGIDVVVLDGWLASDEERKGIPSWHLLLYYRQFQLPVVALVGPNGLPGRLQDRGVFPLPRGTGPEEVAKMVDVVLDRMDRSARVS